MVKLKVLSIFVFALFALLLLPTQKNSSVICAATGWTCCSPTGTASPYPNATNPQCGQGPAASCANGCCSTELKNPGSNGGINECGAGTVSNTCTLATGGGTGTAACLGRTTPPNLTLKVNQLYNLNTNAFNYGPSQIGGILTVSSLPLVVSASPASRNVCCHWVYGSGNNDLGWPVTVTALKEGSSIVTNTFGNDGKALCSSKSVVTVKGTQDPLVCRPGAKCVSATGSFTPGSGITCSMPVTTDTSFGTPTYYMQCKPFKGTVAASVISKTSTNGTFAGFTIATGVTSLNCSFRYCEKATNGIITCSNWGAAN